MGAPLIVALVDEGLGNSAYLVDLGEGSWLAVDPSCDLRALAGHRVTHVAETHLHADFVTGATQLGRDGATVLASAAGGREYAHTGLRDGDRVDLSGLALEVIATPGHTDEHLAYVLRDGTRPVAVFSGGSLIVGAVARTDLVDPDRTEELARAQYASVQRLLALPDDTPLYPTHGAGSFCSAPPGAERTSTIGRERASNPLLHVSDADTFVTQLLASLGSYPSYFHRLAEVNRRGPAPASPALAPLSPAAVTRLVDAGATVVDVRPTSAYAAGHIPGSLAIPLRGVYATWLGWLADPAAPLVFVREPGQDAADIAWGALKVGFDNLAGELDGGLGAWAADGRPLAVTATIGPGELDGRTPLDVRQDNEYDAGHLDGSCHIELGELARRMADLPDRPLVTMCAHGERAASAASLLERAGRRDVAVLTGAGPDTVAAATGQALRTG